MRENTFEIKHVAYQPEEFTISNPAYNLRKTEHGIWEFTIRFETSTHLQRDEELANSIDA